MTLRLRLSAARALLAAAPGLVTLDRLASTPRDALSELRELATAPRAIVRASAERIAAAAGVELDTLFEAA